VSADEHLPLTEQINSSTADLDRLGTRELLRRINDEDRRAAWAVEREIDVIAAAVDEITARLQRGGRLHYFGAGSSGRLGVLDAAEIPPTFSAPADLVIGHIAGGKEALVRAVEAAEDDAPAGKRDVLAAGVTEKDAVIGVSASGATPYVIGAMNAARACGALTIAITSSHDSALANAANMVIARLTGAEVISGSTRMKAGRAQKMTLNMISSAVMIRCGKVYSNLMVDLKATNEKLRQRAVRLTQLLTGADEEAVRRALEKTGYRVKYAAVMLRRNCDLATAEALLAQTNGFLRPLLDKQEGAPPDR